MPQECIFLYLNDRARDDDFSHVNVAHHILRDSLEPVRKIHFPAADSESLFLDDLKGLRDVHFPQTDILKCVSTDFRSPVLERYRLQVHAVLKRGLEYLGHGAWNVDDPQAATLEHSVLSAFAQNRQPLVQAHFEKPLTLAEGPVPDAYKSLRRSELV